MAKRPRGSGSLFLRGEVWWYACQRLGIERTSSCSTSKTTAQAKLDAAMREAEQGILPCKLTVADLIEGALAEYERQGRKSIKSAKERNKHLGPALGNLIVKQITTKRLKEYATMREAEGAAKATINREFALLRFGFNVARGEGKLQLVPRFPMFRENNTRTGFLAQGDYSNLANACAKRGLWLRAMLELSYQFGWRSGEIKSMLVSQVDIPSRTLRLEPHTTKSDEGREAIMPQVLFALVEQCTMGKQPTDFLFTREKRAPVVSDFRKAWAEATKEAGIPDLLFHDLRRSAVRNMIRRGLPQSVAMKISGHKTDAVFRRYNIVDQADLQLAADKMSQPIPSVTIESHSAQTEVSGRAN